MIENDQLNDRRSSIGVGLLGCGVVGGGVAHRILTGPRLRGVDVKIHRVLVRDLKKDRFPADVRPLLTDDASRILSDPNIDVVVECMGGIAPTLAYTEVALRAGKHVITANKTLVASYGSRLTELSNSRAVFFRYEAAVGAATPVVRTVRSIAGADEIHEVGGILNGTTNYILTKLEKGATYLEALEAAQSEGFAEADPSNDVDGADAAQKLTILVAAAFGMWLPWESIPRRGIRDVGPDDIALARRLGCRLKLVATARRTPGGAVVASVAPTYIPADHPFAAPQGVENIVRIDARHAGPIIVGGLGAGRSATASAIISDLADIADAQRSAYSSAAITYTHPA
ncbi:MAG TPA: homoserine dehydrogenase [Candidatus Eremiobacteraceae bacterium]